MNNRAVSRLLLVRRHDVGWMGLYLLLFFLDRPTANPTTRATTTRRTTRAMMQSFLKPPRPAMNLLSRKSSNFSPFGPTTSWKVYVGGTLLLYSGGSPRNLRLKGR